MSRANRRNWARVVMGSVAVASATMARAAEPSSRPNIVFVLLDDLRWNALGCMGHPFVQSPNIDRLAREGVLFRNAFVVTPYCSPSRACILTGQYAHKHGIVANEDKQGTLGVASHKLITFPLLLQRSGYETAYCGKWHMGDDDSPRPGFDRWVSFKGQGKYVNPPLNVDGKQVTTTGYVTDILSDYATEFVKKPHEKPFVLYLSHKAVHTSFMPAPRHKTLYADQPIARAPSANDKAEGKPMLTRKGARTDESFGPKAGARDEDIRNQLRCVAAVDEGIGKLREALEETKQLDNTLIVFTSDNGFLWGEHGMGNKMAAYEESIRVPLVARYPKLIKAGTVLEQQVLNVDFAPTFLDVAGVPIPVNMHGQSMVPLFKDGLVPWRKTFLAEYFADEDSNDAVPSWQGVRSERWKYIHFLPPAPQGLDELYDLKADPYEMKNVINEPSAKAGLEEMKSELERLLKETR